MGNQRFRGLVAYKGKSTKLTLNWELKLFDMTFIIACIATAAGDDDNFFCSSSCQIRRNSLVVILNTTKS